LRKGEEQRERILDELETLLIDEGAGVLTMDRVAEAAGLSKGGLIYHFPTKEALLAGFQERVAKVGGPGRRPHARRPGRRGGVLHLLGGPARLGS
jgi:AcrR family transcriptional regulator